ncbi:MAG: hypothetical protein WC878_08190 [Candidatus Paceibacterota bacterium]|jgi:hypothetical protein
MKKKVLFDRSVSFEKNKFGHCVVTIIGQEIKGEEEIERLESSGFVLSQFAKIILTSGGYDKKHRLEKGKRYRIALIPKSEIGDTVTAEYMKYFGKKFGYEIPKAGIMPRIREAFSDEKMKEMNLETIIGFHKPIVAYLDHTFIFRIDRDLYDDGLCLGAALWSEEMDNVFCGKEAFAFMVPSADA